MSFLDSRLLRRNPVIMGPLGICITIFFNAHTINRSFYQYMHRFSCISTRRYGIEWQGSTGMECGYRLFNWADYWVNPEEWTTFIFSVDSSGTRFSPVDFWRQFSILGFGDTSVVIGKLFCAMGLDAGRSLEEFKKNYDNRFPLDKYKR